MTMKHTLLTEQLQAIENNITKVIEGYSVGVSESLYYESKRLNTLTTVLIIFDRYLRRFNYY